MSNFWDSPIATGADWLGQFGQAGQNAMDATTKVPGGIPEAPDLHVPMKGAASGSGGIFGALGALGMLAGGATMAKGYSALKDGNPDNDGEAWFDMIGGGATAGQGATSMLTPFINASSTAGKALGPLGAMFGIVGGGMQLGKGVAELEKGDAQGAFDVGQGGANALAGAGTLLGAPPVAAVASAASIGLTTGNLLAKAADSDYTKTGLWGKTAGGKNKSAMDWGSSWGTWVDGHIGDKDASHPSVLGAIAAGAGGIVGGVAGAGQALYNWL